ncbi:MAG: transglutaminase family protein [Clostridiaceae bacterium]
MDNNFNPVSVGLILVFIFPILKGFLSKFSANNMKFDLIDIENNISFLVSIFLGLTVGKNFAINENQNIIAFLSKNLPNVIYKYSVEYPRSIFIIIVLLTIMIFYLLITVILKLLNQITFYPIFESIESTLRRKSVFFQRIIGMISQFPKAIIYTIITTFLLNIIGIFYSKENVNNYLNSSTVYQVISKNIVVPITSSNIAKSIPKIIGDSFKIEVVKNGERSPDNLEGTSTLVYFNGVTLDDGIKSNDEINNLAVELVYNKSNTISKAKEIYNYVSKNIKYDYDKASEILRNDFSTSSGAIPTYYSKKGVCFDYACLFVAMCRANNIKVKMVTGEGYNGTDWSPHAWNQVYIPEQDTWINIDTTFSQGEANYFNNSNFNDDHRNSKVVGQW